MRSRLAADRLFHQRAAEVVGAGHQAHLCQLRTHLYPGNLDVRDPRPQQQARNGHQAHIFRHRRAGARTHVIEQDVALVNESERYELGEAAGLFLDVAE